MTPLFVAAAATGLVGMIVRPLLVELAAAIGWIAVALATLFGQALVMMLALSVVPGVEFDSFWTAGGGRLDRGRLRHRPDLADQRWHGRVVRGHPAAAPC